MLLDDFGVGLLVVILCEAAALLTGIKIDRSFVEEIGESQQDRAIVAAIAGLAHGLGLHVVAEGWSRRNNWPSCATSAATRCRVSFVPPTTGGRHCPRLLAPGNTGGHGYHQLD